VSRSVREWLRRERNRIVRERLRAQGYVLDYFFVYKDVEAILRTAAKGSSRRLHEERVARMEGGSYGTK
jgi:hypothetical protein